MYEATNPTFEKGISMSSLTAYAPQITILDNVVNVIDGLYSLNDMHKASGKADKHRPTFFLRNQETKDLITELTEETADVRKCTSGNSQVIRVVKGGNDRSLQGTYVCKELVYRYAMWISAKFALIVIRTFDALVTRTDAKQREALVSACDKLAIGNTLRSDVYTMVANHFGYEKVTQIPAPLLPEAVAFVYHVILAKKENNNTNQTYSENVGHLVRHMYYISSWFRSVRVPLNMMNPAIVNEVSSHMISGVFSAQILNGQIAERFNPMISNDVQWSVKTH